MSTVELEALTEKLTADARATVERDPYLAALTGVLVGIVVASLERAVEDDAQLRERVADAGVDLAAVTDTAVVLAVAKVADVPANAGDIEGVDEDDPTIAERYGPPPSAQEMQEVHARQAARVQETIDRVAARSLSRAAAAKRLGVSPQSVSDRKKAGALSAIRRGREWLFPSWQFQDDATLPGLAQVIATWPGSALALADWAEHPAVDLGGRTPAQALAAGDIDAVLLLEQAIAAATW